MEKGTGEKPSVQEVEDRFGIPVIPIVTMAHLIHHLESHPTLSHYVDAMRAYRQAYGV